MKRVLVSKAKFDNALGTLLKSKPVPREKIKSRGKHGPKTPILGKQ
jgi:predicted RNA-binding protein (virulence factor B family)